MFHTQDPQTLGAIVQYLVAMRPGDRDLYTAVIACPPNPHIYTEDYRQIIFFLVLNTVQPTYSIICNSLLQSVPSVSYL